MAEKREAPEAQARAPGREDRYATAAGNPFLTSRKAKGHAGGTLYTVTPSAGPAFCIAVNGRTQWALDRLSRAGRGHGMNRLQIHYLRRMHGLTEAQASALAALVWGALQ